MGSAVVARGTQAPSHSGPITDEAAALLAIGTGLSWSQLATDEALKQLKQLKGAAMQDLQLKQLKDAVLQDSQLL